jgi:hypothetical protein
MPLELSEGVPCCKLKEKDPNPITMALLAEQISKHRYGTLEPSQYAALPSSKIATYLEEILKISRA